MRRTIVAAAVAALALSALPASAGGAHQHVQGSVTAPAKHPQDGSCYPGLHRRATVLSNGQGNGTLGYSFDIDKKTANKPFTLSVDDGDGYIDLDIIFYTEFGTTEQAADTQYAPPTVGFEHRDADGEAGIVPKGMTKAIVCIYLDEAAGSPGTNAAFTYTAGKGVKLPKGS